MNVIERRVGHKLVTFNSAVHGIVRVCALVLLEVTAFCKERALPDLINIFYSKKVLFLDDYFLQLDVRQTSFVVVCCMLYDL